MSEWIETLFSFFEDIFNIWNIRPRSMDAEMFTPRRYRYSVASEVPLHWLMTILRYSNSKCIMQ